MNKRKVEKYLPLAIEAINYDECKILKELKEKDTNKEYKAIPKTFRGYISSFGAAVTMGSFKSAVAFFSTQSGADEPRQELMRALWYMVKKEWKSASEVCNAVLRVSDKKELATLREDFLNASVAVKLALNAFKLEK